MDIVQRVKDITLKPKDTWPAIKAEPSTIQELYTSYAAILAAIPPLASFIGMSLFGFPLLSSSYQASFGIGISHALVSYALSLVGLYVVAQIINALAPSFGSQKNLLNAMKVTVFSSTPSWIAGFLMIIPTLAPLAMLLSFYSLYLFYLGLPVMMDTPKDKCLGYFMITLIISIVVLIIIGTISRSLFGFGGLGWR